MSYIIPVLTIQLAIHAAEVYIDVKQGHEPSAARAPTQLEAVVRKKIVLGGSVRRGEKFTRRLTNHLTFELFPSQYGWNIEILDDRLKFGLARLTPPFHGANPIYIEGWHFRNAANTGPNRGDVNFPQEMREFIFSSRFEQMIENGDEEYWQSPEKVCEAAKDGYGILTITQLRLGNLVASQQAWIEKMRFRVDIGMGDSHRSTGPWCSLPVGGK